jgi:L-2-hydroxyglutarate oxidase LhgO
MNDADVLVVGAGVVGLAVARALALEGRSVVVVEARGAIGEETSARNSEVIHSGIYYPTGSLKARLCVRGRALLYAYLGERGLPHRRCGKLIVAADADELAGLVALKAKGEANGVEGLALISAADAQALEPALACVGALLCPETGIFDSHAYMLSLQGDAEAAGAVFAFHAPFVSATQGADGFAVEIGGAEPMRLGVGALVNAAGLSASRVARAAGAAAPETRYAKGNYFGLPGRAPFSRLIYPAPQTHGLGVHLTFDLGGAARFGPDVQWIETPDYDVDPARAPAFEAAIRRYWPGLPEGALAPAYAGVRPKISGPRDPAADFRIDGPREHGVPGLVNLLGIESPGLTSSLAIAEEVAKVVGSRQ